MFSFGTSNENGMKLFPVQICLAIFAMMAAVLSESDTPGFVDAVERALSVTTDSYRPHSFSPVELARIAITIKQYKKMELRCSPPDLVSIMDTASLIYGKYCRAYSDYLRQATNSKCIFDIPPLVFNHSYLCLRILNLILSIVIDSACNYVLVMWNRSDYSQQCGVCSFLVYLKPLLN